jgi:hypothetical protein
MLCWFAILCINLGVALGSGTLANALLRMFVGFVSVPVGTYASFYIILSPRHARRWWLQFRFVAANWTRPNLIIARGSRRKA